MMNFMAMWTGIHGGNYAKVEEMACLYYAVLKTCERLCSSAVALSSSNS
jgi:hypothetical protein